MNITQRFKAIQRQLCAGLHEREDSMTVALLSVLAGQSVFLFGPPGTAKSLMARRLSCAFKDSQHFEYLMQKFSTPEEIFGPIDITQLKQGKYQRKTKGYLPTADFAFLDEIWKSNPAILNTLLTITNERIFRNGDAEDKTPLKALIGASNELPQPGLGLEALWDRFVVRLEVPPLQERSNFEALLQGSAVEAKIEIAPELAFSTDEWQHWMQHEIEAVQLSPETLRFIHAMKVGIAAQGTDFYVSDRRWLRATKLLKSSAFFSGRPQTNLADALLLRHCLWSGPDHQPMLEALINDSISAACAQATDWKSLDALVTQVESLLKKNPHDLEALTGLLAGKINILFHANAMRCVQREAMGDPQYTLMPRNAQCLDTQFVEINNLDVKQRLLQINRLLA